VKTDELIESLSSGLAPVSRGAVLRRLVIGVGAGVLVSTLLMLVTLGLRPDLHAAMGTGMFWMKFFYALVIALIGLWIVERLARPGVRADLQTLLEIVPLGAIAFIAIVKLADAPPEMRMPMMMGHSAMVCPWLILGLSLPILAGGIWALRGLAPVRLTQAGFALGILAGATSAFVYGFHCNENGMPFVAIFYTLGIAAAGLVGAILGRFVLRW
jgi:hypothetical protein